MSVNHEMKLQPAPFDSIKAGTKTIESRLYDEKRQLIQVGDTITFSRQPDLTEKIVTHVVALLRYPSFQALLADFPPEQFGRPNREDLLSELRQFYSEKDEKKYGVLGIKLAL